jgi:hypothetical protein
MRGFSRPANNIAAVAVCHIIVALLAATSAHAHLTFACAPENAAHQGFGVITSTALPMRQIQLGVKYSF